MGAHLHVVPDPEPDEAPGPGDRPVLAPVPVPAIVAPRRAPEAETAPSAAPEPDEDDVLDQGDEGTDEPGEYDEDAPRGYMTVPDLRPYVDPRPLAALGPLAVEAGKTAGPSLLRALGRFCRALGRLFRELGQMLAWYGCGLRVLLVLLAGWLSGKYGTRGSLGVRFGVVAFLVYAVVKLSTQYAYAPWIAFAVALTATVMAATGAIEIPPSKATKKETGGADGKGKGAKGKGTEAPAKGKKAPAGKGAEEGQEEIPDVSKEAPAEAPRSSWADRFFQRPGSPAERPTEPPAEGSEEAVEEAAEEAEEEADREGAEEADGGEEETPAEAPPAPSREAVIRALHHLYRGGSGVLLTVLSEHLSTADTRALKGVLTEVQIPHRQGVRTPAGNGPGVHREDIPPLPFSQGSLQGVGVVAGQAANANANNTANAPEEGLDAYPTDWTREQIERGFRSVLDPERGPSASKIERWPGS